MRDFLKRIKEWFLDNKWYIAAYVVFIALFWFIGMPKMSAATAYFGLCVLHLVYFAAVYFFRNIYPD